MAYRGNPAKKLQKRLSALVGKWQRSKRVKNSVFSDQVKKILSSNGGNVITMSSL